MATTTSDIAALLRPGLAAVIGDYNTYEDEWKEIYSHHISDKQAEYEVEMKLLNIAQMKQEGASVSYDKMAQRFQTTYFHKTFGIGFILTRQALLDNLYKDRFPMAVTSLKDSLRQAKNIKAASIFNLGFNPSSPIGDGQPLYSTTHPIDGGIVSNTFTVPAQLNETSLEDAITNISLFRNAAGLLVKNTPKRLIVPPALQFTASRLLNSKYRVGTANNDINAIYHDNYISHGYMVNHFLASPTAWFIQTDNSNGFKYYEREPLDIDIFTDIDTDNLKVRAIERYSFGNSDFRSTFGSQGA